MMERRTLFGALVSAALSPGRPEVAAVEAGEVFGQHFVPRGAEPRADDKVVLVPITAIARRTTP